MPLRIHRFVRACACVRLIFLPPPVQPPSAAPQESLSWATRALLFFRWWLLLVDQVFWHALWTIDDVFFPAYRSIDLKGSVFIVGAWLAGWLAASLLLSSAAFSLCVCV